MILTSWLCLSGSALAAEPAPAPDYTKQIAPIFTKYCKGCHNSEEANGELNLESFQTLMQGGENGPSLVAGKVDASRLIQLIEKKAEPFMPPEDNKPPSAKEIALLKAWIASGAKGPAKGHSTPAPLVTPKIATRGEVRRSIRAAAYSPDGKSIALARYGDVEIVSSSDHSPVKLLSDHAGHVNDVGFSADGRVLYVVSGEAGLFGEATLWKTDGWAQSHKIRAHRDSIYSAAMSLDGKMLATGSYDHTVKIWDTTTGESIIAMSGHNGAVFGLAFHPGGSILASASGDGTVKLWNVADGERLDTFNEPTKGQYTVAFSPDGRNVVAGGIDNRIRVWEIREDGREGTNAIARSQFAHQAPILRARYSADGKTLVTSSEDLTVKVWDTHEFKQQQAIKGQSDWVAGLAVSPDNSTFLAGRLDGSMTVYRLRSNEGQQTTDAVPLAGVVLPAPRDDVSPEAELPLVDENEPNDLPNQAMPISLPTRVQGVLLPATEQGEDADLYQLKANAGQTWVIETTAARDKSPADTKIEVLHQDGRPVERLLLKAVRDSSITFRPINSSQDQARLTNWEEMQLNQYLYMNGEVCRLFRAPRGPDSGFQFYKNGGSRRCYFDTSGTVHAKDNSVYIVEPYASDAELDDNGLPVFHVNYVNDDDGERELGSDSRLVFTAPADGMYLVRVTDVRGFGGEKFEYKLDVRPPRPDFKVTIDGMNPSVAAGSGRRITVKLDRIDNFDGDVRVDIDGLPEGYHVSSPIVVQSGHLSAQGVVNVDANIPRTKTDADPVLALKPGQTDPELTNRIDWSQVAITATAEIHGKTVVQQVGDLGEIKVTPAPEFVVRLKPDATTDNADGNEPVISIAAGTTVTARVIVERNGYDGDIKFQVDNLPHGVIVDNIGLSGVLVREGESQRQIFLTAADWVPESARLIHAVGDRKGNEASGPIRFEVRSADRLAGQ